MLSSEVKRLKESEGGVQVLCEVMQRYEKMAVDEAMRKERMTKIQQMIKEKCTKEFILKFYTEDEYAEAEKDLQQLS